MGDFGSYRGEEVRAVVHARNIGSVTVQWQTANFDGVNYRAVDVGERIVLDTVVISCSISASVSIWNSLDNAYAAVVVAGKPHTPNLNTPIFWPVEKGSSEGTMLVTTNSTSDTIVVLTGRIVKG